MVSHPYFNMAGAGNGTVLDQAAMINGDKIPPIDSTLIPTGKMMDVPGTEKNSRTTIHKFLPTNLPS